MKAQLKSWAFLRLRYLSDFVLSGLIDSRCRLQAACEGINKQLAVFCMGISLKFH